MEPVSFALAIGGIPSIFTSCVDCFQYLQLGRHFGEDYSVSLAQLEAAHMRLLRWGEPMGFLDEKFDANKLFQKGQWKAEEIEKAKEWLSVILMLFEKAQANSEQYEKYFAASKDDLIIPNSAAELSKAGNEKRRLIDWSKAVIKKRQHNLSLGKKTQWALYEKQQFDDMISKVSMLTTNLVELFPLLKPRQEELCKEEVQTLPTESMRDLLEVIKDKDKLLSLAVANEAKDTRQYFLDITFDGKGFAHLGNVHERGSGMAAQGLTMKGAKIGGDGKFHGGHVFK